LGAGRPSRLRLRGGAASFCEGACNPGESMAAKTVDLVEATRDKRAPRRKRERRGLFTFTYRVGRCSLACSGEFRGLARGLSRNIDCLSESAPTKCQLPDVAYPNQIFRCGHHAILRVCRCRGLTSPGVRADLIVAFLIAAEQVMTLLLAEDNDVIQAIDNGMTLAILADRIDEPRRIPFAKGIEPKSGDPLCPWLQRQRMAPRYAPPRSRMVYCGGSLQRLR
jgi:hypothetical protein